MASIIALLVAPPFLFSDLTALPDTAGAAVGLVLSTSAVFSVLVLRTDEHPLLRLHARPGRALLAGQHASPRCSPPRRSASAPRAGSSRATWALAALVSVMTAGILLVEAIRAPR